MTKSKIYKVAQLAIMRDDVLANADKLEILREFMSREDLELAWEKNREKENADA